MFYPPIRRNCHPGHWLPLAGFAFFLAFGLSLDAGAASRQRLNGGHVPAAVARLAPTGNLPNSQRLNLAIGLPLRNPEELDHLLQELCDPTSPRFRRYLTPEQFTERFGPTENDYQALMDFAKSDGLTVTATHPNRVVLDVAGAVMDIARTFHLTMRVYTHPWEAREFYAPDVEPSLDFAVPILHISGLDNYSLPHPNFKLRPAGAAANTTPNSGTGPSGTYRGSDFRTAYVPGTALTGTGQNVGLLQFDGFYASDIATYISQAGLPTIPVTVVPVDGGVSTPGTGNGEVCLDIEMVMSMAPGVSGIYAYEAPNPSPWVDLLSRMANHTNSLGKPLCNQLSCSWGGGLPDASAEQIFKQMAAQGQSFFNATGDSDAFTGDIEFPSDSTNITEVGGTTLTTGTGATYTSETVWNWGLQSGSYVGSSGGISTYYAIPSYQQGISMSANQGSTTKRNVPDVALTADDVYVTYDNGSTGTFGGTSCAAPLWAGFTALINQQAAAAGQSPVGFLNPVLYTIGKGTSYATAFHDTTTGNNFSSSSPSKFSAVAGYDLCTGWGTPNGTNLINALTAPPILAPTVVSNSFVLVSEGCPNGVVDPAETVTVNFGLKNIGTASTTNLVATLLSTGGILSRSGPQTYGVLGINGTAMVQPFTFTATGSCGGTSTASLQLLDGAADLGTVTFTFRLGQAGSSNVFSQSFDSVTAPALPAGWTTSTSGSQSAWVTSASARDTTPNALFSTDPSKVGVNEVDSPVITLPDGQAQLTFRNNYDLETSYDGGVLEIKMGSGGWTDILAAGGSFVSGGYNYTLSSAYSNPLAGRQAWSGNSGGFITTVVNLPATASSQTIQLRWRCGSDSSLKATGWYVDTVSVTCSLYTCCTASTDLEVSLAASPEPVLAGQNLTYSLTVSNLGPATASNVTLTDALPASITFVSASPGCVNLGGKVVCNVGTLPSGGGTNFTVVVTPTAAGLITNILTVASPTPDPNPANNTAANVTTVDAAPTIIVQPTSQVAIAGTNLTFQVAAAGTAPLAYQWLFNGSNVAGAVNSALTLTNVQVAEAGTYTVLVTNAFGAAGSSNAALTVLVGPGILTQPANQTVVAGAGVAFSVVAAGSAPLSYQWFFEETNLLSGATADTLSLSSAQLAEAGVYSVIITNIVGAVTSSLARLTVLVPPAITTQPSNQTVVVGTNVSFAVAATGTGPLAYQWAFDGTNLAGATADTLPLTNVQPDHAGAYTVMVTNVAGFSTSAVASLTVLVPPAITTQPSDQTVVVGTNASFTVAATGTGPLAYQWAFGGTNLAGATADTLLLTNVQPDQAGAYMVVVTNVAGFATSAVASLIVRVPPAITTQPSNQTVVVGSNISFTVTASGTGPLVYQWTFGGTNLSGATADTLFLTNVQSVQSGSYAVVITNLAGSLISASASLTVLPLGTIITISLTGTEVSISFTSQPGLNYLLEYKNFLEDAAWTPLSPPVTAPGGPMVLQDTNAPATSRYYRLRCE